MNVDGEDEDGRIGFKDFLCTVAVVHVKVEDGDALELRVRQQRVARADGHVVDQAEALRADVSQ